MLRFYNLPIKAFIISTADGYKKGKALPFHRVAFNTIRFSGMKYAQYELAFSLFGEIIKYGIDFLFYLGLTKNRLYSFSQLAKQYSVRRYKTPYFSNHRTVDWLAAHRINSGISAFNNQIFGSNILTYFKGKPFLNLHPGLLPNFKGVEPIVPLFLSQQKYAGVSLHEITKRIDGGQVVLQHRFRIQDGDTVFSLNQKSWQYGIALFNHWINHFTQESERPQLDSLNPDLDYFGFPDKTSIDQMFKMNRCLFKWNEVCGLLTLDLKSQRFYDMQTAAPKPTSSNEDNTLSIDNRTA